MDVNPEQDPFIDYAKKKPIPGSRIIVKHGDKEYPIRFNSDKGWTAEYAEDVLIASFKYWRYE